MDTGRNKSRGTENKSNEATDRKLVYWAFFGALLAMLFLLLYLGLGS